MLEREREEVGRTPKKKKRTNEIFLDTKKK